MLTYQIIQNITEGDWIFRPKDVNRILKGGAFDTRKINSEQIFFAWKGDHNDGHSYIEKLKNTSIQLLIVEKEVELIENIAILKVNDSLHALHQMARYVAHTFQGKVITLTGSNGKTTTKTWLTNVLNLQYNILVNEGSFNNHIGCPITVLNLTQEHEILLLEMGTSGMGELELLSSIVPADYTILLNVGYAHIGKFKNLESTYKAKLEIFSHQKKHAVSFIPANDSKLVNSHFSSPVILFGTGAQKYFVETKQIYPFENKQNVVYQSQEGKKVISIPTIGPHIPTLVSLIIGISEELGMDWEGIQKGLESLPIVKGRATFKQGMNKTLLLDDTYNANPDSVLNMLETLTLFPQKKRIAVIGNLSELESNLEITKKLFVSKLPAKIDCLFFTGDTGNVLSKCIQENFPNIEVRFFKSIQTLINEVIELIKIDTEVIIGIKGSRNSHMERVLYALQGKRTHCFLEDCSKLMFCDICPEFKPKKVTI